MVTVLCLVQGGECGRIGCRKARISSGVAAVPVKVCEMATIVVMNVWVEMDSKLSCIESVACSKAENARRAGVCGSESSQITYLGPPDFFSPSCSRYKLYAIFCLVNIC